MVKCQIRSIINHGITRTQLFLLGRQCFIKRVANNLTPLHLQVPHPKATMIQEATITNIRMEGNLRVIVLRERVSMVLIIKRRKTHKAGNKILLIDSNKILKLMAIMSIIT